MFSSSDSLRELRVQLKSVQEPAKLDANVNGTIEFDEFRNFICQQLGYHVGGVNEGNNSLARLVTEENILNLFKEIDHSHDNKISMQEYILWRDNKVTTLIGTPSKSTTTSKSSENLVKQINHVRNKLRTHAPNKTDASDESTVPVATNPGEVPQQPSNMSNSGEQIVTIPPAATASNASETTPNGSKALDGPGSTPGAMSVPGAARPAGEGKDATTTLSKDAEIVDIVESAENAAIASKDAKDSKDPKDASAAANVTDPKADEIANKNLGVAGETGSNNDNMHNNASSSGGGIDASHAPLAQGCQDFQTSQIPQISQDSTESAAPAAPAAMAQTGPSAEAAHPAETLETSENMKNAGGKIISDASGAVPKGATGATNSPNDPTKGTTYGSGENGGSGGSNSSSSSNNSSSSNSNNSNNSNASENNGDFAQLSQQWEDDLMDGNEIDAKENEEFLKSFSEVPQELDTEIFLVRHGRTQWNHTHKIQGQLDSNLIDEGIDGAKMVGQKLCFLHRDNRKFSHCYVSPLGRAQHTATLILRQFLSFDAASNRFDTTRNDTRNVVNPANGVAAAAAPNGASGNDAGAAGAVGADLVGSQVVQNAENLIDFERLNVEFGNRKLPFEVDLDARLMERNFGAFQGRTSAEIKEDLPQEFELLVGGEDGFEWKPPGNENFDAPESRKDVQQRCVDFLNDVSNLHRGERILVVSHGGAIDAMLRSVLERTMKRRCFYVRNCAINVVLREARTGKWFVSALGDDGWKHRYHWIDTVRNRNINEMDPDAPGRNGMNGINGTQSMPVLGALREVEENKSQFDMAQERALEQEDIVWSSVDRDRSDANLVGDDDEKRGMMDSVPTWMIYAAGVVTGVAIERFVLGKRN